MFQNSSTQLSILTPEKPSHIILRDYQQAVKTGIRDRINEGIYRILVYGPTGSGKTAIFSSLITDLLSEGNRVMLLTHREFLIDQTIRTFERFGVDEGDIGVIKAGYPENRSRPLQICGIQTLARRKFPQDAPDYLISDEAHTVCWYSVYARLCDRYENAIKLGFTASPWRLRPHIEYFGQWFDTIVMGPSIKELMEMGYLSRVRYFGYGGLIDFGKLDTDSSGDFRSSQVEQEMIENDVCQKVVEEVLKLCVGRTGVIFNAGVRQSKLQTELLNEAGIITKHIDADTSIKERSLMFDELTKGEIQCISSVGCLTEGFDVPSIGYIILARATKSKSLYFQVAGRGLRIAPGKENCFLLDFGGNIKRHGWLSNHQEITLDPKESSEQEMTKTCPVEDGGCGAEVWIFSQVCPECGYEFPPGTKDNSEQFESEFGELFDPETLELVKYARKYRKTKFAKNQEPDRLWQLFKKKFPEQVLFGEWLYGTIFAGVDTPENRQKLIDYLKPYAPNRMVNSQLYRAWMRHHIELEFGKPGRKHRIGKDKFSEASNSLDWWRVLEIHPNAQWQDIKANYTKLCQQYHPENTLDEQLSQKAIARLNWAYSLAKLSLEGQLELFDLFGKKSKLEDTMHQLILDGHGNIWSSKFADNQWILTRRDQIVRVTAEDIIKNYRWLTLEDVIEICKKCVDRNQLKFFRKRISPHIFSEALKVIGYSYDRL
ncbi:MAG: DEAD/DEAH box helicase family protein [Limnoraphis sp.]